VVPGLSSLKLPANALLGISGVVESLCLWSDQSRRLFTLGLRFSGKYLPTWVHPVILPKDVGLLFRNA
jgi:hypothetical protein